MTTLTLLLAFLSSSVLSAPALNKESLITNVSMEEMEVIQNGQLISEFILRIFKGIDSSANY